MTVQQLVEHLYTLNPDKEQILINNQLYRYNDYYNRLESLNNTIKAGIACPKCHAIEFTLNYGDYKMIANCKCGHSMTVYDG